MADGVYRSSMTCFFTPSSCAIGLPVVVHVRGPRQLRLSMSEEGSCQVVSNSRGGIARLGESFRFVEGLCYQG